MNPNQKDTLFVYLVLYIPTLAMILLIFGTPAGLMTGIGINSLLSGKNTGGSAIITSVSVEKVYAQCMLTLSYSVKTENNNNLHSLGTVSALCMPDAIGKSVNICYNRWNPNNVGIDDINISKDVCSGTGYDVAIRLIWAGAILLFIMTCLLIFISIYAWSTWPRYDYVDDIEDNRKMEMVNIC